ncbi:MAG: hypothetical protein IT267_11350 [Saprospiraceae bacterium]|nr:hypothetical protein [Saprospiraceae bacterium]
MQIIINEDMLLSDIQKEFSLRFPFLKIEFFKNPHQDKEASGKSSLLPNDLKVKAIHSLIQNSAPISISGSMSVTELEQIFHDQYGLNIQVFRKSGNVWIETTVTDDWTLDKQNQEAADFIHAAKEAKNSDRNKFLY